LNVDCGTVLAAPLVEYGGLCCVGQSNITVKCTVTSPSACASKLDIYLEH
jgi:hypothetical protein